MKKSWSFIIVAGLAAIIAVSTGGCRSDVYYHNRAVERAREYLLKEATELSAEDKYFVMFNDPVFLTSPIIGTKDYETKLSGNAPVLSDQLNQICVTWLIPGHDEWYMVYGASNGRMDFRYPERLIRKKAALSKVGNLERATDTARTYARDNLFDLMSVKEQNFIRFHFPAVYETDFEPNFNPTGNADEKDIEKARTKAEKSIQYSLVWQIPDDNDIAVFCGYGGKEMQGWNINFAGKTSAEELRAHTIQLIKTPEEFYRVFPEKYAVPEKTTADLEKK